MTILSAVTMTAARHLVSGLCKATGGVVAEHVAEGAFQTVVAHFSDHSQKLPRLIAAANDRAWTTLEIAFGGERFFGWLTGTTDRSLANDIRSHFDSVSPKQLPGDREAFLRTCLKELREARRRGVLTQGGVTPQSLRQQAGDLNRFAAPASLADAQRHAVGAVAGVIEEARLPSLAHFLRLPTPHGSLLLVAFDWYFNDAITRDAELSTKLILARLDRPTNAGMEKVAQLLDSRLVEIQSVLSDIADAVIETRDRVRRLEEGQEETNRLLRLLAAKGIRHGTALLTDSLVLQSPGPTHQKAPELLAES